MIYRCKVCNTKVEFLQKYFMTINYSSKRSAKLYYCKTRKSIIEQNDVIEKRV
jgi:hypothetical protein